MINELYKITDAELESILNTNVTITEKIDAPYVNVILNESSFILLKSNYKIITNIDCALNDMYYDIKNALNEIIEPVRERIVNTHGNVVIGLFYVPSQTPRTITYNKIENNKFIYSSCKSVATNKRIKDFDLSLYCPDILPQPKIKDILITDSEIETFKKLKDGIISGLFAVNKLIKKTYSGNKIKDIEGIVLSTEKNKIYQISINRPEEKMNVAEHKIYRDVVIKDFIEWYNTNDHSTVKGTYINIVNELFIGYINNTTIVDRYSIEPEDLLPPIVGYFGDIAYDLVNNDIIKTICEHNEIFKCIYRILLNTIRRDTLILSKDTMLSNDDVSNWKKIFKQIQSRIK